MKVKLSYTQADSIADELIARLAPHCQRIEKAGSLRRRKSEIGDIELLAIPKFTLDLFGNPSGDHELNGIDWTQYGRVVKQGPKYKQIELEKITLDLFIATPPAEFGVLFMIRTGPAEYSHKMVTPRNQRGLMPSCYHFKDGAIWSHNHIIPTPEERDVFDLFGMVTIYLTHIGLLKSV